MAFKVGFIVRAPGGDPEKNMTFLKTENIEVTTVVVEMADSSQMIKVCKELVFEKGIHALVLCPAVSNEVVAKITEVVEGKASLFVGRGDFESVHLATQITGKEWFSK
jgi:hypothetical protein